MDSFPPNVERIAAPPFSLDAARRRHPPLDPLAEAPEVDSAETTEPSLSARRPHRHPRLELVAGSAVPDPTPAQITDARERFLSQTVRAVAPTPLPPRGAAGQPSMALLQRIPRLLPGRGTPGHEA